MVSVAVTRFPLLRTIGENAADGASIAVAVWFWRLPKLQRRGIHCSCGPKLKILDLVID